MYRKFFKPVFDFLAALILLILLSPVMLILICAGIVQYNGKPFFTQQRIGYKEKIFRLIKFRTMNERRDLQKNLLPDNERLTSFGKFMRKTSLDELPQLINVIKRDMSMIGPRPLLIKYLPWYTIAERRRHKVMPGLTGLAQVKGRNQLSWDQRLQLDALYATTISFSLDLKIIFQTLQIIFTAKHISVDPRSIMDDLDVERKNKRSYRIGENFILRKPTLQDTEQLLAVKNNMEATQSLVDTHQAYDHDAIQKWITFHTRQSENDLFVIEDLANQKIIGHIALYDINPFSESCEFGILIGLPDYWQRGIGRIATTEMIEIAFHELMLNSIFLDVLQSNTRAVNLYLSLGFEVIKETPVTNPGGVPDILFSMKKMHDD